MEAGGGVMFGWSVGGGMAGGDASRLCPSSVAGASRSARSSSTSSDRFVSPDESVGGELRLGTRSLSPIWNVTRFKDFWRRSRNALKYERGGDGRTGFAAFASASFVVFTS